MPWPATSVADTVAALKVEPVIVIDESNTCGLAQASPGATTHDWLTATGGAIGYAIPAVGAAITAPDPRVLCPHADRPAMDTTSRLWTRRGDTSRHHPSPTTTVPTTSCASSGNASAGSTPGSNASDLLDLVPHRVSSNSPRTWESPHAAYTPPKSSPTPAAATSSNPDPPHDAVVRAPLR